MPQAATFPQSTLAMAASLLHSVPWDLGENPLKNPFVVWDPITGERWELPLLSWSFNPYSWNAAVLCHRGPFLVVLVGTDHEGMFA